MCFKNKLGAKLDLKQINESNLRDDELLFSESVGRFIIEIEPKNYDTIAEIANKYGVSARKIGKVDKNPFIEIRGLKSDKLELDIYKLKELYDSTIPKLMEI
jgi:phosphoribosylformylglycinamidine synthase